MFTLNLTIMVLSTPAQAGAIELAALDLLHVSHDPTAPAASGDPSASGALPSPSAEPPAASVTHTPS